MIAAVIFQTSFFNMFSFYGRRPDLLILVVIYAGMHGGPRIGLLAAIFGGMIVDLFSVGIFGVSAIAYTVVVVVLGNFMRRLQRNNISVQVAITLGAAITSGAVYYLVTVLLNPEIEFFSPWAKVIFPLGVVTAVVAPVVFAVFHRILPFPKVYFTNYEQG